MLYIAKYNKKAIPAAINVAKSFIKNDDYYAMYNPNKYGSFINDEPPIRCTETIYKNEWPYDKIGYEWSDYYIPDYGTVRELYEFNPSDEWFIGKTIKWVTCAENIMEIQFLEDGIKIKAEGARHGIPSIEVLKEIDPFLEEIEVYETWKPEWKPWENADYYRTEETM